MHTRGIIPCTRLIPQHAPSSYQPPATHHKHPTHPSHPQTHPTKTFQTIPQKCPQKTSPTTQRGILDKHGVELIGAKLPSIDKAEDRELFRIAMEKIGLKCAQSEIATTMEEARRAAEIIGDFPLVIRPAFTLGGTGGGIAYNWDEYNEICAAGIAASMTNQVRQGRGCFG